jgi:DNA-binding CsgD family transcriptional regulator
MSAPATIAERIRLLMADGEPRASADIAAKIGGSNSKVGQYLRIAREPGAKQEIHAVDKGGYMGAVRYVIGKGENICMSPAPATLAQMAARSDDEMTDAELDAKHRGLARWWPKPDVLVLSAMDSMVRMGASHADR